VRGHRKYRTGRVTPPFLILHGLHGKFPEHWQMWLAERLRDAGETVAYPDLPDPDLPDLPAWRDALDAELDALPAPPAVLCYSVACLLWLHHVEAGGLPAERVLLVAPPSPRSPVPELASFLPPPFPALRGAELWCSDDDEQCPEGAARAYGEPLGIPTQLIPGGGHLNSDAGYGPWPAVEAWCLRR
jgi:uncharacterized protein